MAQNPRFPPSRQRRRRGPIYLHVPIPSIAPLNYSIDEAPAADQASSLFFRRLPAEMREKILRDAFGDCELHIGFAYSAHRASSELAARWPGHWYSRRCHDPRALAGDDEHEHQRPRWMDTCYESAKDCTKLSPGTRPESAKVGAMGFMLACRQAYVEASHILYGTNTIRVSGTLLSQLLLRQAAVPNSPVVMNPSRLPMITRLELQWDFNLWNPYREFTDHDERGKLHEALHLLPKAFPNLQWLHVILSGALCPWIGAHLAIDANFAEWEGFLLKPLLRASQGLKKAKYISFALQVGVFLVVREAAQRSRRGRDGKIDRRFLERQLAQDSKFGIWGTEEWYPFGVDEAGQGRAGEGYWVACAPDRLYRRLHMHRHRP